MVEIRSSSDDRISAHGAGRPRLACGEPRGRLLHPLHARDPGAGTAGGLRRTGPFQHPPDTTRRPPAIPQDRGRFPLYPPFAQQLPDRRRAGGASRDPCRAPQLRRSFPNFASRMRSGSAVEPRNRGLRKLVGKRAQSMRQTNALGTCPNQRRRRAPNAPVVVAGAGAWPASAGARRARGRTWREAETRELPGSGMHQNTLRARACTCNEKITRGAPVSRTAPGSRERSDGNAVPGAATARPWNLTADGAEKAPTARSALGREPANGKSHEAHRSPERRQGSRRGAPGTPFPGPPRRGEKTPFAGSRALQARQLGLAGSDARQNVLHARTRPCEETSHKAHMSPRQRQGCRAAGAGNAVSGARTPRPCNPRASGIARAPQARHALGRGPTGRGLHNTRRLSDSRQGGWAPGAGSA
ncbi:hypothetical protein ACSSS7_007348 [Eimeria intestinalis]